MKVLRIILVLLGLLVVLFLGVGLFGPTGMDVSHTKVVKAPMSSVYEQVIEFKNWPNWSPWQEMDPEMKVTYGENGSRGVGGSYSWDGPQTGVGEMEIREAVEGEKIGMDLGFDMGDGMDYNTCDMMFKEVPEGTEVTWTFKSSDKDGFMERIFNVVGPSMLKGSYEKGLNNLEQAAIDNPYVEKKTLPIEEGVREADYDGFYYVGEKYSDVKIEDVSSDDFASSFMKVFAHLGVTGNMDKVVQPPLSVNEAYDEETTVSTFVVAMRTTEKVDGGADLVSEYVMPHKALTYIHVGPYENLPASYEKIVEVAMAKGYEMLFPCYEIYLTDPETEPDTSKWKTEIVLPVEWKEAM